MPEILSLRQENSKTFKLADGSEQLVISLGAIHYKDNYADPDEQWKDIDLNWEGNRITKAPYELTLEGNKVTIRDKKTGEVSTIELLDIGGVPIPAQAWEHSKGLAKAFDTDLEIVAENTRVRFTRILKSDKAPKDAQFKVTGKIPFRVRASDKESELRVETSLVDGKLTEELMPDQVIKYPVRIDPTWQVGASTDDCQYTWSTSALALTTPHQVAGAYDGTDYMIGGGMRFLNVTIPQGNVIIEAYLTLRCSASKSGTVCNTRISAEDVDDAITFADDGAAFETRWAARTTARVDWDAIPAWTAETDYNSPECKTIEQELVDRPGWESGFDQVWFWDDFDDRSTHADSRRMGHSYDGSTTYCAQLVVVHATAVASLAGSLTSSGTLSIKTLVTKSGSLTSSGVLGRNIAVSLAGSLTPSGTLAGAIIFFKSLAGTLTSSGSLGIKVVKSLAGTLTTSGTIGIKTFKSLAGSLTSSGALGVKVFKSLAGTLTPSGTVSSAKKMFKTLTGTLTSSGTLSNIYKQFKTLAGSLTIVGTISLIKKAHRMLVDFTGRDLKDDNDEWRKLQ